MVKDNLKRLEQNLIRKSELLDKLQELSDKQFAFFDDPAMEAEEFDNYMEEYGERLQELTVLNEEADELYESLHLVQFSEGGDFATQIDTLKKLISEVADKTNSYQEKEESVKQNLENYFDNERKSLGSGRKTSKAALDYYRSMNRSNVIPPQFMDQKK